MRKKTVSHFIPLVGKYMTLSPTPSYKVVWIRGITGRAGHGVDKGLRSFMNQARVGEHMARATLIIVVTKRLLITEVGGSLELSQG